MEPKIACETCDQYKVCVACVSKLGFGKAKWRCRRCRENPWYLSRASWSDEQLWVSRINSLSHSVGTGCDIVIPLYGESKGFILYWKILRFFMQTGVQKSLQSPQRLTWIMLGLKYKVQSLYNQNTLNTDQVKEWMLIHMFKHDSFYGQIRDQETKSERYKRPEFLFSPIKNALNPTKATIDKVMKLMFDPAFIDHVCLI